MKHLLFSILIVAVVVGMCRPAAAGTVFTLKTEVSGSGGGDATVYVDKTRLRIDSSEKGKDYSVIFKGGGEEMRYWLVDHAASACALAPPTVVCLSEFLVEHHQYHLHAEVVVEKVHRVKEACAWCYCTVKLLARLALLQISPPK